MPEKNIDIIVGARPNFVKCAVLTRKMKKGPFNVRLVHTGQHYDRMMSDVFFKDLSIPAPDINLNVGSSSHAVQTGQIMMRYESLIKKQPPELTMVFGDVNSTIAAVLAASKMHVKTAHIEAGLRSRNMNMPEEINRIVTDSIADYLFTPSADAFDNLIKEGRNRKNIFNVGNIMIDAMTEHMVSIDSIDVGRRFKINEKYMYMTLHRPYNVDNEERLLQIIRFINRISERISIVMPLHPRTQSQLKKTEMIDKLSADIKIIKPVSYLESIKLIKESQAVITDSGGIQEESTFLNIPCFTLRPQTERPVTVTMGTNTIIEPDDRAFGLIVSGKRKRASHIENWDGRTSMRIIKVINEILFNAQ